MGCWRSPRRRRAAAAGAARRWPLRISLPPRISIVSPGTPITRLMRSAFSARVAKDDDVATLRQMREHPPAERRKAEGEAVARIAVGPFGDDQIVADVQRRKHRSRGDVEGLDDEAPERPGEHQRARGKSARGSRRSPAVRCSGRRRRGVVDERIRSAVSARPRNRSSRGGICRAVPLCAAAMAERQQRAARRR